MDYKENSMEAAMRCIIFACAGDGKVSEEEFEASLQETDHLEQWFQMSGMFSSVFSSMFSGMFGEEEEEEEEEEEIVFEAISEETLKEIVKDVLAKTSRCESAADHKAYAALCASSITHDSMQIRIPVVCLSLCGIDSKASLVDVGAQNLDEHLDKKEIRNIKYLCSAMNQDFKYLEKRYLDTITFYDDNKLQDGETVELDKGDIPAGENTPIQLMKIGVLCAGSDIDVSFTYETLAEAYFMILCDIARAKGEKIIKVQSGEKICEAIDEIAFSWMDQIDKKIVDDVNEMAKNRSADMEKELDYNHAYDAPRDAYSEDCYRVLKEELALITDKSMQKLAYKYAFWLTKADNDQSWGYRVRIVHEMFSGEDPREEVQDQTDEELHCLEIMREHFDFDEDMFYGFMRRLEDGDLGYL